MRYKAGDNVINLQPRSGCVSGSNQAVVSRKGAQGVVGTKSRIVSSWGGHKAVALTEAQLEGDVREALSP